MLPYESSLSSYAQKVKIALREKGLSFETKRHPGGAGRVARSEIRFSGPDEMPL